MKYVKLKITSKNKESLAYFYNHLFYRRDLRQNFNLLKKNFKFLNSKKRFTILKAPHVYKTAQEQFEIRYYKDEYFIQTTNYLKFLKFIKKIRFEKFSDIKITIKLVIINQKKNLVNFSLKYFDKKINYKLKTTKILKMYFKFYFIQKFLIGLDISKEIT